MFSRVLVANRGEIARRIIRTLRGLGVESVAVYSDGDADSAHVREADRAVPIGPDPASESYLKVVAIIEAALKSGAEAIHPGYGFVSESAEFARACAEAGIVFIGPGTHALEVMGDKVRARAHLRPSGVPEVPGFADRDERGERLSDEMIVDHAERIGFPVLVKPSAGGGGKGMEIVHRADGMREALASARRLARSAFGDDTLLIERLIARPRHIEVQVFGTATGDILALGERECTLQRRHQKVVEEAPNAGGITAATVEALALAAVRAAASVDYVGAGTVEFLVDADRPDEFFFIEMNTRLQVEHPVTEEVLGLDLVELQVRTAAGEDVVELLRGRGHELLAVHDPDTGDVAGWRIEPSGHAVEARVYAEAPERGFLPSVGEVLEYIEPDGARIDSGVDAGDTVSASYDPMIAKIITHASSREEALRALDDALAETVILGVDTNIAFLRQLLADDRVVRGDLDTGLIDTLLPVTLGDPPPEVLESVAAAFTELSEEPARADWASELWRARTGWRLGKGGHHAAPPLTLVDDAGRQYETVPRYVDGVALAFDDEEEGRAGALVVWAAYRGSSWRFTSPSRRDRTFAALNGERGASRERCEAPMPGSVTRIHVTEGETVDAGQALVSIEAMKMEHPVVAPHAGRVRIHVELGEQVRRGQELASVEKQEEGL